MRKYGFLVVLLNLIITFALISYTNKGATSGSRTEIKQHRDRYNEMMAHIDEIAKDSESKVLFIGTSIFQYFLDPRVFDSFMREQGAETTSYNLSFSGNMGAGMTAICQTLNLEFKKRKTRFKSIVFEASSISYSRRFYARRAELTEYVFPQLFLSHEAWREAFLNDPIETLYMWINQLIQPSDKIFVSFLPQEISLSHQPPGWAGVSSIFHNRAFIERIKWNPETRGLSNWNFPESRPLYDQKQTRIHQPENWSKVIKRFLIGHEINSRYQFSERLLDQFNQAIQTCSKFSDKVYLLVLPYSPSLESVTSQFIDEDFFLKEIQKGHQARILDFRKVRSITDQDFADPTHLKHESLNLYLSDLAQILAEDFKEPKN